MNLLPTEIPIPYLSNRLQLVWDAPKTVMVAGSEPWLRASRRQIDNILDGQMFDIPLRDELWLTVYPPRVDGLWRCESDETGSKIVGRGKTTDQAVEDWQKRFSATFQRLLEMQPFEMFDEDVELWGRMQNLIDLHKYKSTKPLVIRQIGKVVKKRPGLTVVEWEDGTKEKVRLEAFDEVFSRYQPGQAFEATVQRLPYSFSLIRADALRKLPASNNSNNDQAKALWDRVVEKTIPQFEEKIDEDFWLNSKE